MEKLIKKKRRKMKKIRFPIMVSLIPEPSKFNNMVTFRLRYKDTKTGKIITELGRKLPFRAYGNEIEDPKNWTDADAIKVQAQADINKFGYVPNGTITDFFSLFIYVADEHENESTSKNYHNSLDEWFRPFVKEKYGITKSLPFSRLEDGTLLKEYRNHLLKKCCSQNTAGLHMRLINAVKEVAWDKRLIIQNKKIPTIRQMPVDKDVLEKDEIEKLFLTACEIPDIKRAFIFSCISGISKKDQYNLTWKEILQEDDGMRLSTKRNKTNIPIRNHLNPIAEVILGTFGEPKDLVFPGLPKNTYNYYLKKWLHEAGITKKITSHNGRHTFAALFKLQDDDIKALAIAFGHASIHTTSFSYSHINNKKMKKNTSLADINFNIQAPNKNQIQAGNLI